MLDSVIMIILWILAFAGVALIYPVPYFIEKKGVAGNVNTAMKITGIVLALVSLAVLKFTGLLD